MELEEIVENVFHVSFSSAEDLALTFLRFQEHYESPRFRGKIFTLKEFEQWYTANSKKGKRTGKFTYCQDWAGFIVPSYILSPFYEGKFDPLSKRERNLLSLFQDKETDFYLIGTATKITGKTHSAIFRHEVAHGLFYVNPQYHRQVIKLLNQLTKKELKKLYSSLSAEGYHPATHLDETHAYLLEAPEQFAKTGVNPKKIKQLSIQLRKTFNTYCTNPEIKIDKF